MKADLLFQPRDFWIGVFWIYPHDVFGQKTGECRIYVGLLPMVVLRLVFP